MVVGTDSRLINPKAVASGADPWRRRGSEESSVVGVVGTAGVAVDDEDGDAGIMGVADDLLEKSPFPDDIPTLTSSNDNMIVKLLRDVTQSLFPSLRQVIIACQ